MTALFHRLVHCVKAKVPYWSRLFLRSQRQSMPETIRVGVFGTEGRKKTVLRVGDAVTLTKIPDALRLPSPVVTELLPGRRLVVTYWVRAGSTGAHRQKRIEVSARDVETAAPTFSIGNVVRVKRAMTPVLVDVGTEGKLIGGDGKTWHVSFRVKEVNGTPLDTMLNVSQEGVPGDALELVKEEESEEFESEEEEEESEDEVAPLPEKRTVLPRDTDSTLWNTSPVTSVVQKSRSSEPRSNEPRSSVLSGGASSVVGCTAVSSVLSSTLSQFGNLSPAHVAALKAAGASNAQLCIMDADEAFYTLAPARAVAKFKKGF